MTRLPSNVHSGACSSSNTRSLKCVPLALSSLSWSVRNESGLMRVAVGMVFPRIRTQQSNTAVDTMGIRPTRRRSEREVSGPDDLMTGRAERFDRRVQFLALDQHIVRVKRRHSKNRDSRVRQRAKKG